MKIAIEGCAHGELEIIYDVLKALENRHRIKIDLLLLCGDFQSVRNPTDLESMAVPPRFRKLNTFYKYYSGEKKAPVLTIFVGGNHEASNYLSELSYGGWVCPNIYYMGYANVINVGGLRIAGLSGIYKGHDYLRGHFETPPYDNSTLKSVYHVRNVDVFRLKQIKKPIDICISHDWPRGVYKHGDVKQLLRFKPYFRQEIESDKLGSQPNEELLKKLKPSYWFAAHLHCKFVAIVPHEDKERPFTKFLALDKCLPSRDFLRVLDIGEPADNPHIEYDPEWLCILRKTNHLLNVSRRTSYMPGVGGSEPWDFTPSEEEIESVKVHLNGNMKVPSNFVVTAPTFVRNGSWPRNAAFKKYMNPQTQSFCKIFRLTDPQQAVSSSDSFTISDFSGSETDRSSFNVTPHIPEKGATSDEDAEVCSQTDHGEEFPLFFIDRVGSQGRKTTVLNSSRNELDPSIEQQKSVSKLKTEDNVKSCESKNVQDFLKSGPHISDVPAINKKLESFPEIKLGGKPDEVTSSEQSRTPIVFKRRNQSLYSNNEVSVDTVANNCVLKRFKRI